VRTTRLWRQVCRVLVVLIVGVSIGVPVVRDVSAGPASPRRGGTLTAVVQSQIINVDGTRNGHSMLNGLLHQMVEGLVAKDPSGKVVPALATSWEISADQKTWTFKLRANVRFHDGTRLTADAVKRSFERLLNPQYNLDRRRFYVGIETIEAVDDLTVRFRTREPWGPLLTYFTYIAAGILAPSVSGSATVTRSVGTGPFKLEQWVPGDRLVMVRNDDYWGEKAYLDRVVYREVPEASTRVIMVEKGEADLDLEAAASEVVRLQRARSPLAIVNKPSERGLSIDFNTQKGPFKDLRVRQAFARAIDVEAIIKGVMFGQASRLRAFPGCAPGVTGCYEATNLPEYNPTKAKELLGAAGHPDGFEMTLIYGAPRYPRHKEILTAIQGQVGKVGIRMKLVPYEWAGYINELRKTASESTWDATSWAWASVIGDIALNLSSRILISNQPPNCCNIMFYVNERVDRGIKLSEVATNPRVREGILKDVQMTLSEQIPILPLLTYNVSTIASPKIHDVEFRADEETWFLKAWKE